MFINELKEQANVYTKYLKYTGSESEASNTAAGLKYFFKFLENHPYIKKVSDVNRSDIEEYIQYLWEVPYETNNKPYRPCFVYRKLRALNMFFEYLTIQDIDDSWIPKAGLIYSSDYPSPNRRGVKHFPKWFDDYIHKKICEIPKDKKHIRERTMLMFTYHMGSRSIDTCRIELDATFEKNGRHWIRIVSNKLRKEYELPIVDELYEAIAEYKEIKEDGIASRELQVQPITKKKVKYLFVERGKPESLKISFSRKIKKFTDEVLLCAEQEGYDVEQLKELDLTSHKFRHNVAIKLIRMGADPLLVAEFLGHSDLSMAAAYIQEDEDYINELYEELYEDDEIEPIIIKKVDLYNMNDVIQKTSVGWCVHINGKTLCGDNPYECWKCPYLEPIKNDEKYAEYLNEQKIIHTELYDRNIDLGFEKAAEEEKIVIDRITEFQEMLGV